MAATNATMTTRVGRRTSKAWQYRAMAKRKRGKKAGPAVASTDPAIIAEVQAFEEAQDAAALVALVADTDGGRPRRDLARKALHRLRQRGVEIPDAPPGAAGAGGRSAGERVRMAAAQAEDVPISRATAPDGTGAAAAWLVRPGGRSGGLRVAQVVYSEEEGVEEIAIHRLTRSEWRRMWTAMSDERQVLVGDLPAWEVASWLRPALQSDPKSRQARMRVTELRELVAELPEPPEGPATVYGLLGEDPDDGEADGAIDLLEIRPLSRWIPDVAAMQAVLDELEEADRSVLELTEQQKLERTAGIIDKAVDAWADAPTRALMRVRMERVARLLVARGEEDSARRVLAGIRAMARTDSASDLPWLREMMAKWVAPAGPTEEPTP